MTNKIIFLVFMSLILSVLSGIGEMVVFGDAETARLTTLITAPTFTENLGIWGTISSFVDFSWTWFANLFGMLTFSYSMFEGQWQIVRYILFLPIGIGVMSAIVAMIRGTSS